MKGIGKLDAISIKNILDDIFENKCSDLEQIISKLKYVDIAYTVMTYMVKLIRSSKPKDNECYEKVLTISENITIDGANKTFAYNDCKDNVKFKRGPMKNLVGKLWLSLLRCPLPVAIRINVMVALGDSALTQMKDASLLADEIIKSFETNHDLGVASLRAVCHLMRFDQIEYLNVYDIIMEMLDERLFKSVYLARFFEDLDVFLSSINLASDKAADFAKRLSELSQSNVTIQYQPMILKLIINVLKRFPMSQFVINASKTEPEKATKFLFEVKSLQSHFDAEVRTLAEQINVKLNNKEDTMPPTISVALKTKKVKKCKLTIKKAIECLMESNSSLPTLTAIEHFGTTKMQLF